MHNISHAIKHIPILSKRREDRMIREAHNAALNYLRKLSASGQYAISATVIMVTDESLPMLEIMPLDRTINTGQIYEVIYNRTSYGYVMFERPFRAYVDDNDKVHIGWDVDWRLI